MIPTKTMRATTRERVHSIEEERGAAARLSAKRVSSATHYRAAFDSSGHPGYESGTCRLRSMHIVLLTIRPDVVACA